MSRAASIAFVCLGLLMIVAWLAKIVSEITTLRKQTLPVAAVVASQPDGDWFALADGVLDLSQATYFDTRGETPQQIFIPVYPAGDTLRLSPVILLRSKSREYCARVHDLHQGDPEVVVRQMVEHRSDFVIPRPLTEGYRANLKNGEAGKLYERFPTVKLILDDEGRPSYTTAAILVVIGSILVFVLVRAIRAERAERRQERFFNQPGAAHAPPDEQP